MSVADLLKELRLDEWRHKNPFEEHLTYSQKRMWNAPDYEGVALELNAWLQRWQPCLFGRLAAKAGAITYCILKDQELDRSDNEIRDIIQARRLEWSRQAYKGRSSAFVVAVVSPRIAGAVPDAAMAALAQRLAFLYLRREVKIDEIAFDEISLEVPGEDRVTWRWFTGVNYFCSQADGRWWRDHRIPGGMAFSINSVGHLVKSGLLRQGIDGLNELLLGTSSERAGHPITSLPEALEFAMRTIALAAETPSGKATWLLSLPDDRSELPVSTCPVSLPKFLAHKNHCYYGGAYHTDVTLPAEYFRSDVDRPADLKPHVLDFTYLFDQSVDNAEYETVGEGMRVRNNRDDPDVQTSGYKRARSDAALVPITETTLLREALEPNQRD